MSDTATNSKIDENLYSRQIFVLGIDAMKKQASSSVLISGMGGLGVEIAKNIILAGVQSVTIHDTRNAEINDLASNFYLNEKSIGKNRATESFSQLSNLNEYVSVSVKTDDLTNDFIEKYNCVVITDYHSESEIKRISTFCHQKNIKLILTETRGLFAYIFTDFGSNFIVSDPTGEPPSRFLLSFVTRAENGLVTVDEDDLHKLHDGDRVCFEEVEGMTELNGREFEVKFVDHHHFTIGDTRNFGEYTSNHRNGYGNQIIIPQKYDFLEFTEALKDPLRMSEPFDFCTIGQDQQVILAFIASQHYLDKSKKTTPDVAGDELLESAKEVNSIYQIVEEIDEKLIREFARESTAVIGPTCATFGGIAGQEVIKAISGKFGPINQFLAMGYTSSLPKDTTYELKNDRYDPYRIVFGNKQQEVMESLRYFMIGAGAIGCEQLKNFAMMGVATKKDGYVYVTDMDSIERSNLNRQFLFRNKDIGKMKSDIAAIAARQMNSSINIISQQNRLGSESSTIYNDEFYEKLDGVCNALDNVPTRLFSDGRCLFYDKPLLESGTEGTKASYQIIMPHITESYGSKVDPQEGGIPICHVHNTPSTIAECCAWVKEQFVELFENEPKLIASILSDHDYIKNMRKKDFLQFQTILKIAKKFFSDEHCENFEDCIKWARIKFDQFFYYKIKLLIDLYPENSLTKEGLPFWSGKKRFPQVAVFDPNNKLHAKFVKSAAIIRARICRIKAENIENIPQIASKIEVPQFNNSTDDFDIDFDYDGLIKELEPFIEQSRQNPLIPESFEKDDDSNGHIDFIASGTNIRATNFYVETKDDLEIKRIAGQIIPAIATTTAMICGLVALEMYKVHNVDHDKKIEDFRFGYINLAIPSFSLSEPSPCKYDVCTANNIKFFPWDKWVIDGDLVLSEFIDAVKEKYKVEIDMITVESKIIYPNISDFKNTEKRLKKKVSEILTDEFDFPAFNNGQYYIQLECNCSDENGNEVKTPTFCMIIKKH